MHGIRKAEITSPITTLGEDSARLLPLAGLAGVICLAGGAILTFSIKKASFFYLVNFCFFCSIILGCLFFVMTQHLARAGWSVTVRRVAEIIAACIIPMLVLFLPILIPVLMGQDFVYSWNNGMEENTEVASAHDAPEWSLKDERIYNIKSQFLNAPFFGLRNVIYFAAWVIMAVCLFRWSIKQDETGDPGLSRKMQAFCAPMMILWAATVAFASFDWEMSLAPMWYSTMFPVYFFAGSVLGGVSMILLVCILLQRSGRLTDEITVEHYHDLSKLMFAFVVFWGYIAFSQFMLIWYANFPEETFWFQLRSDKGWFFWSMVLLFGHLLIPLLGIMARSVRRNKNFMLFAAIYLLVMHFLDHYWIIMPQMNATISYETGVATGGIPGSFMDLLCVGLMFLGMLGIFIASFCLIAGNRSLIPLKDPRLSEALNYDNP